MPSNDDCDVVEYFVPVLVLVLSVGCRLLFEAGGSKGPAAPKSHDHVCLTRFSSFTIIFQTGQHHNVVRESSIRRQIRHLVATRTTEETEGISIRKKLQSRCLPPAHG